MSSTKDALGRQVSRRGFLTTTALAGAGIAGAGTLLSACGGGSSGGGAGSGGGGGNQAVSWSNWANPGEQVRFKEFTTDYQNKTGVKMTYQTIPNDGYLAKLLTQLAGGSATDVFYVGDGQIAKLIEAKAIQPLDDYLSAADSPVKADATFEGLRQWLVGEDGKTYGICVDCNPSVTWFNKKILGDAGVTTDPAAAFEAGTWTIDTMTDALTKIRQSGKKAMVIEAPWFNWWGYITSQGGTMLDDDGKVVFTDDAKAKEMIGWVIERLKAGDFTYAGALPKGQGGDALFLAGQLGMVNYGRWILPNLKKLNGTFEFDIAPYPTAEAKKVQSVPVYTAGMSMNSKAKDNAASFKFLGSFCNADGQKFRLSGGGNAVPSQSGLDEVVLEGNSPAHAQWFVDTAAAGYGVPKPLYADPERSAKVGDFMNSQWNPDPLKSLTTDQFISNFAKFLTE